MSPRSRRPAATYLEDEYRQLFRNLTYPERVGTIDPEQLAREAKAAGARVLAVDVRTQCYSLCDTQHYVKDPLLGSRDLVRECADACRRHGLKFLGYVAPQSFEPWHRQHPEWQQRDSRGRTVSGMWKTWACTNTGFARQITAELAEIARKYRPHAFYIDGVVIEASACHCAACRAKYRAETGRTLPQGPDWKAPAWYAYLQWRYRQTAEHARRLHEAIHRVDSRIEIIFNCPHAWCGWYAAQSWREALWLDRVGTETAPGVAAPSEAQQFWSTATHVVHRVLTTRMLGSGRKSHTYTYITPEVPEAEAATEINAILASGGTPCIQGCAPHLDRIMGRIAAAEPYLAQSEEVPACGLVFSDLSRDAGYQANDRAFFAGLNGLLRALVEQHVPVQYVGDHQLEQNAFAGFPLLVLGNATTLRPAAWRNLLAWVRAGGTLVATYKTGGVDEVGRAIPGRLLWPSSGLKLRAEVKTEAPWWVDQNGRPQEVIPAVPNQYLLFGPEKAKAWGLDFAWGMRGGGWAEYEIPGYPEANLHVPAAALEVAASADWEQLVPFGYRVKPRDALRTGVGLARRRLGKGSIWYLNCDLGDLFAHGDILPNWKRFLAALLERAAGWRLPLKVDGPECLYVSLWRQPGKSRYVIHLVNDLATCGRPASRGKMRTDHVPVNADLLVRLPRVRSVKLAVGPARLQAKKTADGIRVKLRGIRERAILTVQ